MKKSRRKFFFDFLGVILIVSVVCSFWFLYYFSTKLGPCLIECAENEIQRLTILVMNNCVKKYLDQNPDLDQLLEITRNQKNEIEFIRYNTLEVNKTSHEIVSLLENDFQSLVRGDFEEIGFDLDFIPKDYYEKIHNGVLFTVTMGSATGNSLLANLGPKIPLNLSVVGDTLANVKTNITEYGMNNAMIEVFVEIEVTMVIHMPFLSKKNTVQSKFPLTMEIIQGNVPEYYLGNSLEKGS